MCGGLEIQVPQPQITHTVTVHQLERWTNGSAVRPDARIGKARLKATCPEPENRSGVATSRCAANGPRRHHRPADTRALGQLNHYGTWQGPRAEKHSRGGERKIASRAPLGVLLSADPGAEHDCGQTDTE